MRSLRRLPLCAVAIVFLFSSLLLAQHAAPTVRINAPIDASQLVTIKGSVHPLANAQNDRGPASPSMQLDRLHLILKRSPDQETALRQLIQEQNTPGSPNYHKWLSPAQFAAQFGPSPQDISTVEKWLSDQGFTINNLEPGNQTLDVSGSVGQLQSAFHTQVHKYMVNGQLHYANADNPAIPAALAPVVGGFVSLNNFHYRSYAEKLGEATYDPSTGQAKPSWTISGSNGENFVLSPADYAIQYDLNPVYSTLGLKGDGQTIAIINDSNVNIDLVNQFRTLFGLPANPPQVIIDGNDPGVDGINNPDGPNDDSVEAYLDVEWAGAVAPDATIDLVIAGDTSLENGLNLAAEHAVYSNVAPVVSVSFGLCELFQGSSNAFWNSLWEQAAAQGQTVIVSTGDDGSAGCDDGAEYAVEGLAVNGLASTPYDVAVGGTDFYYSGGASQLGTYWNTTASNTKPTISINASKAPIPEQPWNSSQYGLDLFNYYTANGSSATTVAAGSGGASSAALCSGSYTGTFNSSNGFCSVKPTGYAKPAWQSGITGIPGDGVRDLPDVSLFASNGANNSYYPICATDGDCQPASAGGTVQIYGVGGTSAAAPSFAGIMALVNQSQTLKLGSPQRQGQADTILYAMKAQFPTAFHDVTNGNNSVPCAFSVTASLNTPNCIAVTNPITIVDSNGNSILEGQIGSGTTADYNAAAGYNLATGLGTVDAATLINDWGSVKLATSAVTFNATPTSITHGQSITVSGAVTGSGTPTGNVAIMTDSTEPSQQGQTAFALDGSGNYSGSLSTLPGGNYNIWASYGGDTKNGAQVSSKVPIIVSPENSGIAFGLFANGANQYVTSSSQISGSVDYGTQLMLSARVAPSGDVSALQTCTTSCPAYTSPTGTVAFKDNSSTLNTAVINSEGDAEYNAPFSVGSHSVTASYNGDSSYNASTSSAIPFTVVKDTPQLSGASSLLDSSSNLYSGTGQPTVLTLLVENNAITSAAATGTASFPVPVLPPTGTITLSNSSLSALKGSFPLSAGVDPNTGAPAGIATVVIPANTPSSTGYQVAVAYSGDSNYNAIAASSNTTFSIPIINFNGANGGLASSTTASISGAITPNTTLTISGTVTGQTGHAAPTGSVELYSSGYNLTSASLSAGSGDSSTFQITVDSQEILQGSNQVTIQYYGDSTYLPSAFALTTNISNPLSDFSMVPQSAIVPVTAGSTTGNSVTINLASINGFGGAVNLTCAASAGVSCALSPASATLSGGGSATTALTITAPSSSPSQNYGVLVTGTDAATGEFIHTLAITAAVSGSTAPAQTFTLSNSGAINVNAGVNSNNTSTITVAPLNGFTGTVNLSCAVTSGPSTNPVTCGASNLSAASVNITGTASQAATLTITTSNTTTPGSYTVTVTGTSGGIIVITPVTVNVSMPSFTLPTNGSVSLKIASPGATTGNTAAVAVTPVNGFTGQVNLTCQVTSQPTGANDPVTCGITSSVNITSASAQSGTLTISSTAATSAMSGHKNIFWSGAGGGMVLACVLFFWIPKKRRSWLTMVVLLMFAGSMAGMGCGGGGGGNSGGGSSGGGGNPGTTAGNYIVTVTAKDAATGTITQTTTVNVTIQ